MQEANRSMTDAILATLPTLTVALDENRQIAWLSDSLCQLLGVDSDSVVGQSLEQLQSLPLKQLLSQQTEVMVTRADGEEQVFGLINAKEVGEWLLIHYQSVCNEAKLRDKVEALEQTLEAKAGQHPVTGLLNRQTILQSLNSEVSRSRRYDNPLSVVLMQLQDVEQLMSQSGNDDESPIMRALSYLLKDQMRWADVIGHFNDDQLILVLPETKCDDAQMLTDKLSERIGKLHFEGADQLEIHPQARFGVVQWQRGDDMAMLLRRAQTSLSEALEAA